MKKESQIDLKKLKSIYEKKIPNAVDIIIKEIEEGE